VGVGVFGGRDDVAVAVHPNPSLKDVDLSDVDLLALFRQLRNEPDPALNGWKQARGRGLERLLHEALRRAGLDPRPPYRPSGEEIDGSFKFEGRYFLYEAKWLGDEPAASMIYSFKGKVGGKLIGTIGLFISVAGFSTDAIDALASGKDKDVLLVTGEDLEAALGSAENLRRMLDLKVRAAAEDGVLNFPVQSLVQEPAVPAPQRRRARRRFAETSQCAGMSRRLACRRGWRGRRSCFYLRARRTPGCLRRS
jgi:hypothetical protein